MIKEKKKDYTMDLTEGPILKKIIWFSVPLMLSSMLQLLFNAADVMVVGKFAGDNSLAAVGSTSPIINLITNAFMGLSVGSNVLVARFFASKEEDKLRKTIHTSIAISVICGFALILIGEIAAKQFLIWTQSPAEVIDLSALYLRVYFLGMPATMVYNFGAAILRGVGDTQRPLYYLTFAGVVNVVLNFIFVVFFHMDVAGVAMATVISQCISAALILKCLLAERGAIRLERQHMGVDGPLLRQIVVIGLPAGIQSAMFSLSNVVVQSSINSFGNIAVAGNSAAQNVEAFLAVETKAFAQAIVAFVGQNIGAKKYERVHKIVFTTLLCVLVVDGVLGNLVYLFGAPLLSLYTNSLEVVNQGMIRFTIACIPHFIYGMMDVMAGAVRGMGYSVMPMIVALLGVCAFRVVWVSGLASHPALYNIQNIYVAYPISWAMTLIVHFICYIFVYKKMKKKNNIH